MPRAPPSKRVRAEGPSCLIPTQTGEVVQCLKADEHIFFYAKALTVAVGEAGKRHLNSNWLRRVMFHHSNGVTIAKEPTERLAETRKE